MKLSKKCLLNLADKKLLIELFFAEYKSNSCSYTLIEKCKIVYVQLMIMFKICLLKMFNCK
jgi:hypothetical protein